MIIHTGGRTDTVQYYTDWLMKRFEEGYVLSRNPRFPGRVTRYELTPDKVDCVIFCSKNYRPILPRITEITGRFPTYFQYTITAYGPDIEPEVPSVEESVDTLLELSALVGAERVAWRYEPVLLTGQYTVERHLNTFSRVAERLAGHIDRCIFGFVETHRRLKLNMPELIPLTDGDKDTLARGMGEAAARLGIPLQTCGNHGDYRKYGIEACSCITAEMLERANHIRFKKRSYKGTRPGCERMESRDIGAYDTCLNGCRYCYAAKYPDKARENHLLHDPDSPLLVGQLNPGDIVQQGRQDSFLL